VALAEAGGSFADPYLASETFGVSAAAGGWTSNDLYYRALADMDGDGIADIVGFGEAGAYVSLGDGEGGFRDAYLASEAFGVSPAAGGWASQDTHPRALGDIDGDGAADIIGFAPDGVVVALSSNEWALL
jgi:hypothetical protein